MTVEFILMIIYTIALIGLLAYFAYDSKKTLKKFEESKKNLEESLDYLCKSVEQELAMHHIDCGCSGDCEECEAEEGAECSTAAYYDPEETESEE